MAPRSETDRKGLDDGRAEEAAEQRQLHQVEAAVRRAPAPEPAVTRAPRDVARISLIVLAVLACIALLRLAEDVLIPIVVGVLVSYALEPIVARLVRWHVPRVAAATVVLVALTGGLVFLGYQVKDDVTAIVTELPGAANRLRDAINRHRGAAGPVGKVQRAARELERAATEAAAPPPPARRGVTPVQVEQPPFPVGEYLLAGSKGAFGIAVQIVVVCFVCYYLLVAGDLFKRKLVKLSGPTLDRKKLTLQILQDIDAQIATYLLVRALISLIVGSGTWLLLRLVGLDHAGLWGVAAGVLNIIPYVGPLTVIGGIAVAAFLEFGGMEMILLASGAAALVAGLEGYLLTPWLTSRAAEMNAAAVFVGLLFWGWLWGVWGLLLAVPLLMVTKAVCDRVEELKPLAELLGD